MNDTFGREIKVGDLVAVAGSATAQPFLSIGRVVGPCKEGRGIRVRVFHSNTDAFHRGLRKYRPGDRWHHHTGEVIREPGTPYVASFGISSRIVIITGAEVPEAT